jgi:hypothetical protein
MIKLKKKRNWNHQTESICYFSRKKEKENLIEKDDQRKVIKI